MKKYQFDTITGALLMIASNTEKSPQIELFLSVLAVLFALSAVVNSMRDK